MKIIYANDIKVKDRKGYFVQELLEGKFSSSIKDMIVFHTFIPNGGICRKQWHKKSYELVYFLDEGIGIINDKVYNFNKGDAVFLEPGEKHEWKAVKRDLDMFAIRFPNIINDKYTDEDKTI